MTEATGLRLMIGGEVSGLAATVRTQALGLGLSGWVRLDRDGTLRVHAEGTDSGLQRLVEWLEALDGVSSVQAASAEAEGHEQFGVRGVPAGVFVVQEHRARTHHYDLRLEVEGVMRSWAVPKGPSLDPAVKRLAVEVEDHSLEHNEFEGRAGRGGVILWDRGLYEQGGRVAWPGALDRGHAVFVLHGMKLQGGFALQRTRRGNKPQWLLIKRRDEYARPGSDIVRERPDSVVSHQTLSELLGSEG